MQILQFFLQSYMKTERCLYQFSYIYILPSFNAHHYLWEHLMCNINLSPGTLREVPNEKILLEQRLRKISVFFSLTIIMNPKSGCSSESSEDLKKIDSGDLP